MKSFVLLPLLLSMNLLAEPASAPAELRLSSKLPVVNRSVRIYLPEKVSAGDGVRIREEEGGTVQTLKPQKEEEAIFVEWTPSRTGYHTAEVEGGGSLRFPVVSRNLTFLAWPSLELSEHHLYYLSSCVIVNQASKHPEKVRFWREQGSRVLASSFIGSRQIALERGEEESVRRLLEAWESAMADSGVSGLYVDELGGYPDETGLQKAAVAVRAAMEFRKRHPEALLFTAIAGAPLPEMAAGLRAAGATALLEAYEQWLRASFGTHRFEDYIERRLQVARHTDLSYEYEKPQQALIYLGADGLHGGVSERELEERVRFIRKRAPEMPGIAFYASGRSSRWLHDAGLRSWMDTLCRRYFVDPVLELQSLSLGSDLLRAGEPVEIEVQVGNIGGMRATNLKVHLYAQPLSGGEPVMIGSATLPELEGTRLELVEKDLEEGDYKVHPINGRNVPVFNTPIHYWKDRHTAAFSWKPAKTGLHKVYATLEANPSYTTLQGVLQQEVVVVE